MKTPSINFSDDPTYIEQFYMQERAGKLIDLDCVLKIIEQKRARDFLYLIMEYIESITIDQWVNENPQPDIHEVTELTNKIIAGLRTLPHEQ